MPCTGQPLQWVEVSVLFLAGKCIRHRKPSLELSQASDLPLFILIKNTNFKAIKSKNKTDD